MKEKYIKEIFDYKGKHGMLLVQIMLLLVVIILCPNIECLIGCLIIGGGLFLAKLIDYFRFCKTMWGKSEEELMLVAKELHYPLGVWENYFILTDSYLIKRGWRATIINISDIILVYTKKRIFNSYMFEKLVVVTKNREKSKTIIESTVFIDEFKKIIKRKNPEVLLGYSLKNVKTIKEKYSFIVIDSKFY